MPSDQTPLPGQVYAAPDGRPMLYVRTEVKPGSGEPEHLFLVAEPELRMVAARWLADLPEEAELVRDYDAERRARRLAEEKTAAVLEHAIREEAWTAAMKRAVALLPPEAASDLRRVFRETLGRLLTR